MNNYGSLHAVHSYRWKQWANVALLAQCALLLFSLIFYRERMLFSDAPHVLFRIINSGQLQIAEHRYGSFITQIFPLAGVKLHLSIFILMLLYSAGFNIVFLAASYICYKIFRRYDLCVLAGLYYTLFVSDTFFWTNNEVHQGVAWLLMAYAVYMHHTGNRYLRYVLSAALFALAIWTHPLVMLPAIFLYGFYLIDNRIAVSPSTIIGVVLLLGLAYIKFYQGAHHGYDSGKIELVTELKGDKIKHLFSSPQLRSFVKNCLTNYWLFVLISMAGLTVLIWQKKYLLMSYTVVAVMGYLFLLFITYWEVDGLRFYMESEYMPLTIIACAPFIYYTLPVLKNKQSVWLLAFTFVVRLAYILQSSANFTARVALLDKIDRQMQRKHITKLILTHPSDAVNTTLLMNWGTPVESVVLSSLQQNRNQTSFIIEDDNQLKAFNTASKDTLLGCFEKVPVNAINKAYFRIDTATTYTTMSYDELVR